MKLLITVFALFVSVYSFGQANLRVQTNEIAQIGDLENIVRAWSINNTYVTNIEDVEGSAYMDEQFINGVVTLNTGAKYSSIPLRYNVFNDLIEFRNNSGKVFNINNPEAISELTIGDSKFIYTNCKLHKINEKLFVEVISEGNISLLKRHRMKLQPAKQAETHRPAQPLKLVKMPSEYLIKKGSGEAQIFKNKKELLMLLSDKKEEISELINQQKLSLNDEKDLATIVGYYNGEIKIHLLKYHNN